MSHMNSSIENDQSSADINLPISFFLGLTLIFISIYTFFLFVYPESRSTCYQNEFYFATLGILQIIDQVTPCQLESPRPNKEFQVVCAIKTKAKAFQE